MTTVASAPPSAENGSSSSQKQASSSSSSSNSNIIFDKNSNEKYALHGLLGKGGFAKCFLVKKLANDDGGLKSEVDCSSTAEELAAKIVDKKSLAKPKTKAKLGTEIKIHQSLKHEHVVAFKKFFEDRSNVYIMLEVCHCKSMMELIKTRKRLSELETKYLMIQLLYGVKHMHSQRVIHRDLKLGNLFLDHNMQVKIGDFGLAAQLTYDEERKRTICGTPNYIAPEILTSSQEGHSYEVDVWSIGVILYTLIIGKPPFETSSVKTTYNKIKATSYSFPPHAPITEDARDLICRILTKDPNHRPTIDEILQHDFFAKEAHDMTQCPEILREYAYIETGRMPSYVIREYHRQMPNMARKLNDSLSSGNPQLTERVPFQPIHTNTIANRYNTNSHNQNTGTESDSSSNHSSSHSKKRSSTSSSSRTRNGLQQENQNSHICSTMAQMKLKEARAAQLAQIGVEQVNTTEKLPSPTIWVSQWADFSQKYGLAYKLNTNQTGAHFNDATKMVWYHDTNSVDYYERLKTPEGSYDEKHVYHIDSYPESLKKKITLIKYFHQYLIKNCGSQEQKEEGAVGGSSADAMEDSSMDITDNSQSKIYVKRWMRTKHAVIFRLSNKTVQVCFRDNTEIMLSSEAKLVTYKNVKKAKQTFSLSKIIEVPNPEVAKRLKYTKDILKQLLRNGTV
mmetsp:Transcript_9358/g.34670  ORF Transcript_9358/g.34670 Transcript_9358/m.34670 type:complete len:679 (-) Transcript_9358:170-2206(-)|eukprot:CAMPEP_0117451620 /NCGR_PEP_ID=MMETSP0759-20121206/9110_1 /TAXON_ID=63605 /ORGANISM="Percolomonas cosmopolitus, Strain WS" /LENGTH=678 /DNA_ID=CAMNT_0005244243 /DNA_START=1661 /DNA_END=3697 /DNA_ORIENTATION=+